MVVEIYSKDNCPFCDKAVNLAKLKSLDLTVRKLGVDFEMADMMEKFPSARTFPQIVLDGKSIGGNTEFEQVFK